MEKKYFVKELGKIVSCPFCQTPLVLDHASITGVYTSPDSETLTMIGALVTMFGNCECGKKPFVELTFDEFTSFAWKLAQVAEESGMEEVEVRDDNPLERNGSVSN